MHNVEYKEHILRQFNLLHERRHLVIKRSTTCIVQKVLKQSVNCVWYIGWKLISYFLSLQ